MSMSIFIILGLMFIFAILPIGIYNSLVQLRNNRENAFANIDVQLKQRHDLIPQLVSTTKAYASHERETLENLTKARQTAILAGTIEEKIVAEKAVADALRHFSIQVEAYPDLKANSNFLLLQNEMADLENKLAATRRFFNSATKEFNVSVEKFPNLILAKLFGFQRLSMFDLAEQRKDIEVAPEIKF